MAIANIDTVSGVSFQPVAFTGRRSSSANCSGSCFTLADLARGGGEQTEISKLYEDRFSLACVTLFSKLRAAIRGTAVRTICSHPHCSFGTYFFIDQETKRAVSITLFVDVPGMLQDMEELSRKTTRLQFKLYSGLKVWNALQRHFHEDRAPRGLTFRKFPQTLQGLTDEKLGRDGMEGTFTYRTLLVAGMHFQNAYDNDIERVKRCVIHYATPDEKLYPFCTYNSGPCYREKIECQFSIPWDPKTQQPIAIEA